MIAQNSRPGSFRPTLTEYLCHLLDWRARAMSWCSQNRVQITKAEQCQILPDRASGLECDVSIEP